jgi:hypothetical protein
VSDLRADGGARIDDSCRACSPAHADVPRPAVRAIANAASTGVSTAIGASTVRELAGSRPTSGQHRAGGTRTRRGSPPPSGDLR